VYPGWPLSNIISVYANNLDKNRTFVLRFRVNMNVYLLITHGRHISLITNIVMQWYMYESDLNECTFRKSTQKNDFDRIWHLWPWKWPSNSKSRVASTHTFFIILRLIDLAWMPAINKQCRQRCKISFWLAYYIVYSFRTDFTVLNRYWIRWSCFYWIKGALRCLL